MIHCVQMKAQCVMSKASNWIMMQAMKTLFVLIGMLSSSAYALESMKGIMPGEPDPTGRPGVEKIYKDGVEIGRYLIDDSICPKGKKPFLKLHCAKSDVKVPECAKHAPAVECLKSPKVIKCKRPMVLVPDFDCAKSEKNSN
jgi:hypothetical protein